MMIFIFAAQTQMTTAAHIVNFTQKWHIAQITPQSATKSYNPKKPHSFFIILKTTPHFFGGVFFDPPTDNHA